MQARLAIIEAKEKALAKPRVVAERKPWFCSGCPHNTSTNLPEGSRAVAGIGCHYMVVWMDRTRRRIHRWAARACPGSAQAPFTNEKHLFANLGDGTYFHSGSLAVRAAVAANVPITYKILFNDAVAMTGGQPTDGQITAPQITQQMHAEGVRKIVIVTDEPDKYDAQQELDHSAVNAHGAIGDAWKLAPGVTVHHRDELDRIQRELREYPGVSVLIYDQTCAVEKSGAAARRTRRTDRVSRSGAPRRHQRTGLRGLRRLSASNPTACRSSRSRPSSAASARSISRVATRITRASTASVRASSPSKAASCVRARRSVGGDIPSPAEPQPGSALALDVWRGVTGVGGTGVVTIGQLLGMAAHIEGRGVVGT